MSTLLDQDFPDEEEDDFNPEQEVGSDDEGGAKPSRVSDDEEEAPRKRSAGRGRVDEDDLKDEQDGDNEEDEEDEEDDEDEDDEDDDIDGQPSRKRRKRKRNVFIDVEAEVDEDDDEEPEDEDDLPGEDVHPDDLQELPPGADRDDRIHRELDRQREAQEAMDVEEEAARLKERYGRQSRVAGGGSAIVPQRLLLPTTSDPRIWRFKCRPGKEREIILALQLRIREREHSREPVNIISAFERGGPMAGNLYVEAFKVDDITAALDGVSHVFLGTKPMMIPLEEMPDLLRTRKSKQLDPGMYVRMKRGLYAGDLALVDAVEANGTDITVKLVPRLDYGMNEDANAAAQGFEPDGQGGMKRKRFQKPFAQRPPPRLFSENEARKRHGRFLQSNTGLSNNSWTYQGKEYVDGFLIHTLPINGVMTDNVNPTLEEVTKFAAGAEDGTENLDLAALAATLKQSTAADYLPGDKVELFRGEQKGVIGQAVQVYGELVKVRVEDGPLYGQTIEAPVKDLRKLFKEGDHVKVIGGSKYRDEVGMVVRIREDRVTILTDSNQQEVSVFSKDLREATDSGGATDAAKYDLFDLVQLDAATVACVVKVDRESLGVLDQTGNIRTLLPSNISNRIDRRKFGAVAIDREGHELKVDDTVKEYGGEQREGQIIHLHRAYVFALNRTIRENAGVFVARTNNVVTMNTKGGRVANAGPDLTKMNPALKNGGPGASPMAPPVQKGRDRLIGKTVKIRSGPQKGMIGIVKDAASESSVILELHAKNKKVTMAKDRLVVIDPKTGQVINTDARSFSAGGRMPMSGPPGGRGPMGSQTPGRGFGSHPGGGGGRTPAYAMASRTPAWKQDAGARTPAYGGGGGGGQTAYGGGFGGSTSYGGATSYGGNYGGGSVWGGAGGTSTWNPNTGGRTPAYNSGAKTPAYQGMDASSPDFTTAPTPGNYQDQPTPGGFRGGDGGSYQTPAAYNTPGGFPETPAPYSAETPAADDGPRYD